MMFAILVILLLGLVVYFHYLQGFFSAGISAFLAAVSAMVAIGYHENVVNALLGGKFAAQANAIALVSLFAVSYLLLRLIFDRAVPGNVRFPVLVDKIGAAVSGVVAGIFSVGILVIAAQSLPFGPSIAGYTRYPVSFDIAALVYNQNRAVDAVYDQLDAQRFIDNQPQKLLVPVDDLVISLAEHVTKPGAALSSGNPLTRVHPDYLQELFGQRIGLQPAASRVAQIEKSLNILGVYTVGSLPQDDQERWMLSQFPVGTRAADSVPPPLPATLKPPAGQVLLVVRAQLDIGAMDQKSRMVSFGPGNVRLAASGKNYFPIGTLEGGRTLLRAAPDDYLFAPAAKAVDFVFQVEEADLLVPGENKTFQTKPGAFLEFKRLARQDLPDTVTVGVPPPGDKVQVVRKTGARTTGGTATAGGGAASTGTLAFEGQPTPDGMLPVQIGSGVQGDSGKNETDWGSVVVNSQRFSLLEVNPTRSVQIIRQQAPAYDGLFAPDDKAVVQWKATPQGSTGWEWAEDFGNYEMVDAQGNRYKPNGVAAQVVSANGGNMLVARYDAQRPVTSVPVSTDMKVTDVTLYWVVPSKITLNRLEYKGETVQSFVFQVP